MEYQTTHWPGGVTLLTAPGVFPPGTDSLHLAAFATAASGARVCDLGCGGGILLCLLLGRLREGAAVGVELLPEAAALAAENVTLNGFSDRARILRQDLRALRGVLPAGEFDLVVSNPPYFPVGSGKLPPDAGRAAARSEETCSLDDLCERAAYLLRWGGNFALCHRPERLADLICTLRKHGMEPKRLRYIQHRPERAPSVLLVEARRGGNPGLDTLPPLILSAREEGI